MLFSGRLSHGELAGLSRVLRLNLSAGLTLFDVFRQQSQRGPRNVRPVADIVAKALGGGEGLVDALKKAEWAFPPLFLSLARVGEESGHLPEVFKELEEYFHLEQQLRREFIAQSILPLLQFFAAILVIAFLIWVLGMIATSRNAKPITIFGLSGGRGALIFLACVFVPLTVTVGGYFILRNKLRGMAAVEALLLRIPVLGGCLEAVAMSRLCLAMQLTLDSGMTIMNAMRLSLSATGNSAYSVHAERVAADLKKKRTLTEALTRVRPLSTDFIGMVASAEEAGRVPEMMRHQVDFYREESSRRMKTLARLASGVVWLVYAGCMIFAIFSIAKVYLSGLGA